MPRVTIVPADSLVIVDGRGLNVSLTLPEHVHAIQWDGLTGWVEHSDGTPNTPMTQAEYDVLVVPALAAWESARAAADAPPPEPTPDDRRASLRVAIAARKCAFRDGGFVCDGVRWDSDTDARVAYTELAQRLTVEPSYTTRWKASEGQWVLMTAPLFQAVYATGAAHIATAFAWQEAEEARLAATSDADLAAFVVSNPENFNG